MKKTLKMRVRSAIVQAARLLGSEVRDVQTGELLGRALFLPWKGRILVIGAETAWLPVPVLQKRICYWRQAIGFTVHQGTVPPRGQPALILLAESPFRHAPEKALLVCLDHRDPATVVRDLSEWQKAGFQEDDILLAYGGPQSSFCDIGWTNRVFLSDSRLRTRDHQRERQSYRSVFEGVAAWLEDGAKDFTHIMLMEFDQRPLAPDLARKHLQRMRDTDADVLGYAVQRIDGTLHPHWLGSVECASRTEPVWSMLGTGQFWKREAWAAVTRQRRHADWYLELDMPTTAVEMGFKLGRMGDQEAFVRNVAEKLEFPPVTAKEAGAWTIHPWKTEPAALAASSRD
jgi:hypothetical protein